MNGLRLLFLLIFILLYSITGKAQVNDSIPAVQDSITASPNATGDTSVFSVIDRIEDLNKELATWHILLKRTIDTTFIIAELQKLEERISKSEELLKQPRHNNNLRYLSGSRIIVEGIQEKLKRYQLQVGNYFKKLKQIETGFYLLELDSLQHRSFTNPALQKVYSNQLKRLNDKWKAIQLVSENTSTRLALLQGHLSNLSMRAVDLRETLRFELQSFNSNLLKNKHPLLESSSTDPYYVPMKDEMTETLDFTSQLFIIYTSSKRAVFFWNLVIAVLLICWVYYNHRFLKAKQQYAEKLDTNARRASRHPLASACTLIFCFSAFLYSDPPFIISALFILALLVSLSFLLWDNLPWKIRWRWLGILFLFFRFSVMNLFVDVSYFERWLLAFLNLGCIYILFSTYKLIISRINHYKGLFLLVIIITAAEQLLSVILNFMGYFNAARIVSMNSILNIITAVALKLSIDIILELTFMSYTRLQYHNLVDRSKDFNAMRHRTQNLLVGVGIVTWLTIFARSINIFNYLSDNISSFLLQARNIGSISFTFGSIVIFIGIFVAGILLSRFTGLLIDLLSGSNRRFFGLKNTKLLFRLFIIVTGLIVAFLASGIPMDRFTIILGALSVGIGFGLQHLVNNLVSGIIIAMEKPIRVGDKIELPPYTGIVSEIGLRSSVMKTPEGSDIIIPNGILLSDRLVNWTLTGRRRRISVTFHISINSNLETAKQVIKEIMSNNTGIMQHPEPSLLFEELSLYGIKVELLFWVKDVRDSPVIKSIVIEEVIQKLNEHHVAVVITNKDPENSDGN